MLSETFFVVDRPMNFILGPGRDAVVGGIEDTARVFEQETGELLAHLDARAWRCRWSGRRR